MFTTTNLAVYSDHTAVRGWVVDRQTLSLAATRNNLPAPGNSRLRAVARMRGNTDCYNDTRSARAGNYDDVYRPSCRHAQMLRSKIARWLPIVW